jgi:hypothetical protein
VPVEPASSSRVLLAFPRIGPLRGETHGTTRAPTSPWVGWPIHAALPALHAASSPPRPTSVGPAGTRVPDRFALDVSLQGRIGPATTAGSTMSGRGRYPTRFSAPRLSRLVTLDTVKGAPATNRTRGPKLSAATGPMK